MTFRKFYIENQNGNRIDLNGASGICFEDPSGLGESFNNNYANTNDGFFNQISSTDAQGSVDGTLIFINNAYARYKEFVDWLASSTTLYLIYAPNGTEYYRQVDVKYLTKTEINRGLKWMDVPVSFMAKTPWYLPSAIPIVFNDRDTGTIYDLTYNDDLLYFENAGGSFTAELQPQGHLPAALRITFIGEIVNPVFQLTGVSSGKVYGECAIQQTFSAGEKVELFTSYLNSYVQKTDNQGNVTNLIDYINLTSNPFFRLPVDEKSFLRLTSSGNIVGSITAWVYYYYRTV